MGSRERKWNVMKDVMRRLAVGLFAIVSACSMCVSAFAAETPDGGPLVEDGTSNAYVGVPRSYSAGTRAASDEVGAPFLDTVTAKDIYVTVNAAWAGNYDYVFSGYGDDGNYGVFSVKITDSNYRESKEFRFGPMTHREGRELTGSFAWVDSDSAFLKGGSAMTSWKIVVDSIPGYETVVRKTLGEVDEKGYLHVNYDVTHTYVGNLPETADVIVVADWLVKDASVYGSEKMEVQLYKDDAAEGDVVTLDASNDWTYKWSGLDGDHVYTVKRLSPVAVGYKSTEVTAAWCMDPVVKGDVTVPGGTVPGGSYDDAGVWHPAATVPGGSYDSAGTWHPEAEDTKSIFESDTLHGYVVCSIVNVPEDSRMFHSGVRKVWFDDGEAGRPDELAVDGDASFVHVTALTESEGWKYVWENLIRHGLENYYWHITEVVPEEYEEEYFYNGELELLVNVKQVSPMDGFMLPQTGGGRRQELDAGIVRDRIDVRHRVVGE